MIDSKKMNLLALVLFTFTLVGATLTQENINVNETLTDQTVLPMCSNTEKTSKPIENIAIEARDCMLGYFTLDDIKTRIEIGRNNDILDIVSEEFCLAKRIVQRCVNESLPMAGSCLSNNEQDSLRLLVDITRRVLNFVCYVNGEKIKLFIIAGGIECIENNTSGLERCAKETIADSSLSGLTSENLYQNLMDNVTLCESYNKLQECVFNVLQTCTGGVVPVQLVDSLFDYIKSIALCNPTKY